MVEAQTAKRAIGEVVGSLVASWNRHDASQFAALFAEDADFTNVFGMAVHGRRNIENMHALIFKTMFKDSHLDVIDTSIRFIRPDIAAVDMRWKMTGARDPSGKEWPERTGLLNLLVCEAERAWLIVVSHNMDLPPLERVRELTEFAKTSSMGPVPR